MKKWFMLFIVLIGIATLFDEQVAMIVFNRDSLFTNLFYIYGELPSLILGAIAWLWTMLYLKNTNHPTWMIAFIIYLIFMMSIFIQPMRYLNQFEYWMIIIPLLISVIILKLSNKIEENILNQYHLYFLVIGMTIVLSIFLPQLIKLIWERPRPYVVFNGGDFQAWYIGFNFTFDNAYKSFPSGHSAVVASLLSLTVFRMELKARTYSLLKLTLFVYVFLMMISRMVRGDHYLSDVLIGTTISILIHMYFRERFMVDIKSTLHHAE